uniref:Uncharacterized protein n=1 Tax=Compsopogon caeruleus TaxID=31354 RepID=A0A6T6BWC2_9RHOD|mmetsp:Transcript_15989/g.32106  ORF Transcript_15989/g.32106 Transcript_15989/m.32106 type:complete len:208 (+) Transcript_15989:153-776(+)|eukprot:CAMPEP_0184680618 /NCGR_PEP_ID=MMETSP0312-20130426/3508_1 /TAXON_ID=31354 /ORGANISM="Compsopogon coeruleus, Strain SAG 36.94" /LENGTH=207 /DNA_ID=CAMNT_0027130857 /DNA_START=207 /DNA_END=830 /DNA_ORIENTATION=-
MEGAKHKVKIVIVGDGSVGKTCMLHSYARNEFPTEYVPTVFDTYTASVRISEDLVGLEIWDTAGQDDYDRLRALTYFNTNVIVLCYSVVSKASFENVLNKWAPEVQFRCPDAAVILCGTKTDLRTDPVTLEKLKKKGHYPISTLQGERMQTKVGASAFMECSALTKEGLKDVFDEAIKFGLQSPREPSGKSAPAKSSGLFACFGCLS